MNICIIGDGLTSLSLAKNLTNKKINVHIYHKKKTQNLQSTRTIGISSNNLEYLRSKICNFPQKEAWKIKQIEIYSEKFIKNKILSFKKDENTLFYILKNNEIYCSIKKQLLKNKFFKKSIIIEKNFYEKLLKKNRYDLIINCDPNNYFSTKYFNKKIDKNYYSVAYTTILEHEKIENYTAIQIFTKVGPIAFLPISKNKTSVVFSIEVKDRKYKEKEILDLIKKYNPKYKIKKILEIGSFKLKSSNLRNYYYKNILAFGDLLHRIHPLAGQGFNMTIRDIKVLSEIIQNRINLGMQLDVFILEEFEKKTKSKNFIFASGIDFIYETFNIDKKIKGNNLNKILQFCGENKKLTNTIIKLADNGFRI